MPPIHIHQGFLAGLSSFDSGFPFFKRKTMQIIASNIMPTANEMTDAFIGEPAATPR